uniref:Uncharacterized protein n=1 Tax=Helianthus annuus TaxID=4232 RepID=A0A251RPT5_HELAN
MFKAFGISLLTINDRERRENGGRAAANGCDSRRGCDAHNSGGFQKKRESGRSTG